MKAAVIGAGFMGATHAATCSMLPGVELAYVVDVRPEAAGALAERHGARAATDADEVFADDSVELVVVATSTESHRALVIGALEAGKHVFCEKPIARRLADAEAMLEAARRAPGKAMVGHVLRYLPEYAAIKRLLDAGRIGTPAVVRTERTLYVPPSADTWFTDFERSGGVLYDLAIHDMDFCMACFGPVARVYAKGLMHDEDAPNVGDYALVTLRFEEGTIAHLEASWLYVPGFTMAFEASGSKGIIEYDSRAVQPLVFAPANAKAGGRVGVELPQSLFRESGYAAEMRLFVEAIEQDADPPITFDQAVDVLRVADAAERSLQTGKAVALGAAP